MVDDPSGDMQMAAATTLVLVCKRPRPGYGKQRLARELGRELTCRLAALMLDCALEDLADWPGPTVIAPADPGDEAWAREASPPATVHVQREGNLGERLEALDDTIAQGDPAPRLYIGMDAPGLAGATLRHAAACLADAPVVLIPARDGGVVAMGTARGWPPLAGLPWSRDTLCNALATACEARGHSVTRLGEGADVDTVDALQSLAGTLPDDPRPARRRLLAWLRANLPDGMPA